MRKFLDTNPSEGEVQRYLEAHSRWIPLPHLLGHGLDHNAVITQLELDRDRISDFAYITKNTARWIIVLVELEAPSKRLFTSSTRAEFHSNTQRAIDQVEDWRSYISTHSHRLKERLAPLMALSSPLARNPVSFRYLLVVGRQATPYTERQAARIERLDTDAGITLLTYDSLLRFQPSVPAGPRVVLRHCPNGFRIEHPAMTSLFAFVTTEHLSVKDAARRWYERQGYDIPAWESGEPLVVNHRLPMRRIREAATAVLGARSPNSGMQRTRGASAARR